MSLCCRDAEAQTAAARQQAASGSSGSSGPAGPAAAPRQLSDGADETLRRQPAFCLASFQCLQREHLTPKSNFLTHDAKLKGLK